MISPVNQSIACAPMRVTPSGMVSAVNWQLQKQ